MMYQRRAVAVSGEPFSVRERFSESLHGVKFTGTHNVEKVEIRFLKTGEKRIVPTSELYDTWEPRK